MEWLLLCEKNITSTEARQWMKGTANFGGKKPYSLKLLVVFAYFILSYSCEVVVTLSSPT